MALKDRGPAHLEVRTRDLQQTCLQVAADYGRCHLIWTLREFSELDRNAVDVNQRTLLHLVSANGHSEILPQVLPSDAVDINIVDVRFFFQKVSVLGNGFFFQKWRFFVRQRTPLLESATTGKMSCVHFLAGHSKVNLNYRDQVSFMFS
jgi:hypothetical protein